MALLKGCVGKAAVRAIDVLRDVGKPVVKQIIITDTTTQADLAARRVTMNVKIELPAAADFVRLDIDYTQILPEPWMAPHEVHNRVVSIVFAQLERVQADATDELIDRVVAWVMAGDPCDRLRAIESIVLMTSLDEWHFDKELETDFKSYGRRDAILALVRKEPR